MSDGIGVLSAQLPFTNRKKSSCGRTERSMPEASIPSDRPLDGVCAESPRVPHRMTSRHACLSFMRVPVTKKAFRRAETLAQKSRGNSCFAQKWTRFVPGGFGMPDNVTSRDHHRVVSHDDWLEARTALLTMEKEFTRLRDKLSQARRELPWEAVTKQYAFDGPNGRESLGDLFDGRSQLVVYHFMFDPAWDAGCPHCSHWADSFNGAIVHLNHRDVSMVVISRAPYPKLDAYRRRMGWTFKWLSSFANDFNVDFAVTFTPEEVSAKRAFYNFTIQDPHN